MRVALYARVSRLDQEPDNQLQELRRYVAARGWEAVAFVEHGVSGAKDRRPVLDQLLADVRRRRSTSTTPSRTANSRSSSACRGPRSVVGAGNFGSRSPPAENV
jgi:DNA invertase Pin-like site-specific DNA recombinase